MRRLAFYLSVALLAFGIGSYFVYNFTLRKARVLSEPFISLGKETPQVVSSNQNNEKSRKGEYLSDKEKALLLFQPTINKWLNDEEINYSVAPSAETIQKITNSKLNIVDERGLLSSAQESCNPSLIDVNGDGKDELAILSNCSPPEHCELWIFKKTKKDFAVILSTYTEVENFSLRKSKTKKYFDIETTASYPKSETSLGMDIYKFDGKQYVKEECYDFIYLYKDKNGKFQKLNKPKLISLHCC